MAVAAGVALPGCDDDDIDVTDPPATIGEVAPGDNQGPTCAYEVATATGKMDVKDPDSGETKEKEITYEAYSNKVVTVTLPYDGAVGITRNAAGWHDAITLSGPNGGTLNTNYWLHGATPIKCERPYNVVVLEFAVDAWGVWTLTLPEGVVHAANGQSKIAGRTVTLDLAAIDTQGSVASGLKDYKTDTYKDHSLDQKDAMLGYDIWVKYDFNAPATLADKSLVTVTQYVPTMKDAKLDTIELVGGGPGLNVIKGDELRSWPDENAGKALKNGTEVPDLKLHYGMNLRLLRKEAEAGDGTFKPYLERVKTKDKDGYPDGGELRYKSRIVVKAATGAFTPDNGGKLVYGDEKVADGETAIDVDYKVRDLTDDEVAAWVKEIKDAEPKPEHEKYVEPDLTGLVDLINFADCTPGSDKTPPTAFPITLTWDDGGRFVIKKTASTEIAALVNGGGKIYVKQKGKGQMQVNNDHWKTYPKVEWKQEDEDIAKEERVFVHELSPEMVKLYNLLNEGDVWLLIQGDGLTVSMMGIK